MLIISLKHILYASVYSTANKLFLGAVSYFYAHFGQGTGPILLDNVACSGTESTLLQCGYSTPSSTDTHSEDAGARCQPC